MFTQSLKSPSSQPQPLLLRCTFPNWVFFRAGAEHHTLVESIFHWITLKGNKVNEKQTTTYNGFRTKGNIWTENDKFEIILQCCISEYLIDITLLECRTDVGNSNPSSVFHLNQYFAASFRYGLRHQPEVGYFLSKSFGSFVSSKIQHLC